MTTRINVIVDNGGLSEKAKRQTQANRLQKLEADNRLKVEAAAIEERNNKRALEGVGPDGRPLYGQQVRGGRPDEEPIAANNGSQVGQSLNLGHLWWVWDFESFVLDAGIISIANSTSDYRVERVRSRLRPMLVGCGNGTVWNTLTLGATNQTALPQDDFMVTDGPYPYTTDAGTGQVLTYSINGKRSIGTSISNNTDSEYIILPAGNGNFIFIHAAISRWFTYRTYEPCFKVYPAGGTYENVTLATARPGTIQFTGFTGYNRQIDVFVMSNTGMRRLTPPAALNNMLDVLAPIPSTGNVTVSVRFQHYTFTGIYQRTYPFSTGNLFANVDDGLKLNWDQYGWTPRIFENLNAAYPFVSPSLIKQAPLTNLQYGLADNSRGGYARYKQTQYPGTTPPNIGVNLSLYRDGLPLYYALWPNKNEVPDLTVWDPDYANSGLPKPKLMPRSTLTLASNRVPLNGGTTTDPMFIGKYAAQRMNVVWDWGDPDYCKTMCKALGFTDADLKP